MNRYGITRGYPSGIGFTSAMITTSFWQTYVRFRQGNELPDSPTRGQFFGAAPEELPRPLRFGSGCRRVEDEPGRRAGEVVGVQCEHPLWAHGEDAVGRRIDHVHAVRGSVLGVLRGQHALEGVLVGDPLGPTLHHHRLERVLGRHGAAGLPGQGARLARPVGTAEPESVLMP